MSLEKYCCPSIGTKNTICGSEKRKGGIKHAFVIKQGQTTITDWENEGQWLAAIANGDVIMIEEIRGEYPEPSEVEADKLIGCGNDTELDGFNHVFNWQDRAVNQANNEFYQDLNGCTRYFGWFDCQQNGTDIIHVVEGIDVSFVCKPAVIEAGSNTIQRYMCSAKWTSNFDQFPVQYTAPSGIFT